MLNGIAASIYHSYPTQAARGAQALQGASVRAAAIPQAQPELPITPVTPVRPATVVQSGALNRNTLLSRWESDPAAMAVRGRIQYGEDAQSKNAQAVLTEAGEAAEESKNAQAVLTEGGEAAEESKNAQEVMEEAECQTCKERKYQDGSDDPGVSFKTAAHIDPNQAAAVVRGHEQEHVVREQAKAGREDREVVSQTVTLHTGICPECGRAYVSGGTTRTVTRARQETPQQESEEAERAGKTEMPAA